MAVRETFEVDDRDFNRGLEKIEKAVEQSAKRQTETFAEEGKKAGEKSADEILKSMKATFASKQAQLKEQLTRGMIDRKQFREMSQGAKEEFNKGVLKAMDDLAAKGQLSRAEMTRLGGSLKQVAQATKEAERDTSRWRGGLDRVKTAVFSIKGLFVGIGALAVGRVLQRFFTGSVQEAEASSQVWARLEANVANAGVSYQAVLPQIQAVTRQLQDQTRYGDEETASALAELISMTGDYQGSLEELGTVVDFAAAKKLDLSTAAKLVGRAMVGETSTLRRYGVIVAEGADAMEVLRTQFRGAADVEGAKLSGRLARLRNDWGDIKEAVGEAILGGDEAGQSLTGLADKLVHLEKWVRANEQAIHDFVAAMATSAAGTGSFVAGIVKALQEAGEFWALRSLSPSDRNALLVEQGVEVRMGRIMGGDTSVEGLTKASIQNALELDAVLSRLGKSVDAGLKSELEKTEHILREVDRLLEGAIQKARTVSRGGAPIGGGGLAFPDPSAIERLQMATERLAKAQGEIRNLQMEGGTEQEKTEAVERLAAAHRELEAAIQAAHNAVAAVDTPTMEFPVFDPEWAALVKDTMKTLREDVGLVLQDSFQPLSQALGEIERRTHLVANAELALRDVWLAGGGPEEQVAAEEALAAAKEVLRSKIQQVAQALQDAGVPTWKLRELMQKLADAAEDAGLGAVDAERKWEDWASTIEGLARAVLSVADAMGALDDGSRKALQGVIDVAGGLKEVATGNTIGGVAQTIGGIIGVIGGLQGLFSDDEAEKAAEELKRQLLENARRIQENTQALIEFKAGALSGITGEERDSLMETGTRVAGAFGGAAKPRSIWAAANALQMPVEELLEFFERLEGLTGSDFFDSATGAVKPLEFMKAWEAFSGKGLGAFGETLEGKIDALRWKWAVLGDEMGDFAARVEEFISVIRSVPGAESFADELARVLEEGGPEAANAWLDALAKSFSEGDQSLFAEGGLLAGLDAEDVRRLLEEGNDLIEEWLKGGGPGTSKSVQIGQSITEVQAVEVVAWLQEIAFTLRDMLDLMSLTREVGVSTAAIGGMLGRGDVATFGEGAAPLAGVGGSSSPLIAGDVILQPEVTERQFWGLWARIGEEVLRRAKGRGV